MNAWVWLRVDCAYCTCPTGRIDERNGQLCVFCAACKKYAGYNLPRRELLFALIKRG